MENSSGQLWFCLRSKPKHEHIAAKVLRMEYGVEVYCPQIRYQAASRRGAVWKTEPLFPCYLFARYEQSEMQVKVRYALGVSTIVRVGEKSAIVGDEVIELLKAGMGNEELKIMPPKFVEGDEVWVAEGPMKGLMVVVTQVMPAKDRVRVLLEFLGGKTTAEMSSSALIKKTMHPMAVR